MHSTGHGQVIEELVKRKKNIIGAEIAKINDRLEDDERLIFTSNMIRTVYIETKSNVPSSIHGNFVLLQKLNTADMGFHHYDRMGATRMKESISEYMHFLLIQHLVRNHPPFSMIVDTSDDIEGRHYMIVYFIGIEDNTPITYFYKLVEMTKGSTAQGHMDVLIDALNDDNNLLNSEINTYNDETQTNLTKDEMSSFFQNNLVGFISDGAAVMQGRTGGLVAKLRQFVKSKFFSVHCMAHKLQLVLGQAFK